MVGMERAGQARVLVSLVHVEGSSYRRAGARMLIGESGTYCGTISGGCLEAEVVRKAEWKTRSGAVTERYSTMFDDTAEVPYGLGCGGVLDLLLEPAGTAEYGALMGAMERSLAGEAAVMATWLPVEGRGLRRAVWDADGGVVFRSEGLGEEEMAGVDLASLAAGGDVFAERIEAPQRLYVLGAGDDARPLVNVAAMLGWSVVVAEGRAQLARSERFPEVERVVATRDFAGLGVRGRDAVVVMTHSYEQDRAAMAAMLSLPEPPMYLGLLGAKHRSSLLVSEVAASLGRSVAWCCDRIYAPVGLDLGGEGAASIALAVVAEAHACAEGRLGASRRLTAADVAENVERGGASRYLQAQCAL